MRNRSREVVFGVGSVSLVLVLMVLFGLGPLDPPDGPITETGPSLEDIERKIDALSAITNSVEGPYQSIFIGPGQTEDRLTAEIQVGGHVLLHKIVLRKASVSVFDGPGRMIQDGPVKGVVAGWAYHFPTGQNGTSGVVDSTVEIVFNTEINDGLYLAYDLFDGFGGIPSIQILYKELP